MSISNITSKNNYFHVENKKKLQKILNEEVTSKAFTSIMKINLTIRELNSQRSITLYFYQNSTIKLYLNNEYL